jgi:hypothetical protein
MPYDQSRKKIDIDQLPLPLLREAVYIAIPPFEAKMREDWMSFLLL